MSRELLDINKKFPGVFKSCLTFLSISSNLPTPILYLMLGIYRGSTDGRKGNALNAR